MGSEFRAPCWEDVSHHTTIEDTPGGQVLKFDGQTGASLGVFASQGVYGDAAFIAFSTPEPATWLTGAAVLAIAGLARRRQRLS